MICVLEACTFSALGMCFPKKSEVRMLVWDQNSSEDVYSMVRAIEQLTNNKNMADFVGWTSTTNRHTDLVGCY